MQKKLCLRYVFGSSVWQSVCDRPPGPYICQGSLVSAGPTHFQGGVIYLGQQRQSVCNWYSALIEILCWQRKQRTGPLL